MSWADATEDSWADAVDKNDSWADAMENEAQQPAKEETSSKPFSWGAPIEYDDKASGAGDIRGLEDAFPLPGEKSDSKSGGPGAYRPPRRANDFRGDDVMAELPRGPTSRDEGEDQYDRPRDNGRGERGGYDRRDGGYDRRDGGYDRRDGGYDRRDNDRGYGRDRYDRRDDGYERRGYGGYDRDRDDGYGRDRYSRDRGYDRDRYDRDDRGSRYEREERAPTPFPESPPWTAFLGNLPFRAQEVDVGDFFNGNGCVVEDVRLIQDHEGRMKGYGYIEFADDESLRTALKFNGETLLGRTIRVDVASGRRREGGFDRHTREGRFSTPSTDKWERGSKQPTPRYQPREPRGDRYDRFDREDRGPRYGRGDRDASPRREPRPARTPKKSGVNPFGDAKPRDELAAQAKIRADIASREEAKTGSGGAADVAEKPKSKRLTPISKKDSTNDLPPQPDVMTGESWRNQNKKQGGAGAGRSGGGRRGWERPRRDDGDRRAYGAPSRRSGGNRGWEKPRGEDHRATTRGSEAKSSSSSAPSANPKSASTPKTETSSANAFALLGEEEG